MKRNHVSQSRKPTAPGRRQVLVWALGGRFVFVFSLLIMLGGARTARAMADSLRVEVVNGKSFIIHQVDPKETLYSISRKYGVTVAALVESNPKADAGLSVGQELKVPYVPKIKPEKERTTHKVAPQETLFSISRMYNVSVDELKSWNNLKDNALSAGQELIISRKAAVKLPPPPEAKKLRGVHTVVEKETLFSISKMYGASIAQLKSWNNLTTNEVKPGQNLLVLPPMSIPEKTQPLVPATEPKPTVQEVKISENLIGADEIHEKGMAVLIDGTEGNRKYLAQHKTAKLGTIMKVRNEETKREVFVRVIGPLSDDGVVIRISKSAFDKLGGTDSKINVELIYYK